MLKIVKNVKNNGTYNTFHGPLSQEWIDERYWSLALICHANQSNENLHNFDSGLYWNDVAASYQVGCIDKSRNIPSLKQRNIHEQETPQWNHNSGILRHAPELVPHRRLIDPMCLSPL